MRRMKGRGSGGDDTGGNARQGTAESAGSVGKRTLVETAFAAPSSTVPGKHTLTESVVIQRRSERDVAANAGPPLPAGGGTPLPANLRTLMESLLGADFASVRVHQTPYAQAIGARAFTRGDDLYFAPGAYEPESPHGRELLGHELTHVVQQRQGRVPVTSQVGGAPANDDPALEQEADQMGAKVALAERPAGPSMTAAAPPQNAQPVQLKMEADADHGATPAGPHVDELAEPEAGAEPDVASGPPIQRKPGPKKRQYIPFKIVVSRDMTGEELKATANLQVFGVAHVRSEWKYVKDAYTTADSPVQISVEVSLLRRVRGALNAQSGIDIDETGKVAGADARAKDFLAQPDSDAKSALLAEIDRRYHARSGTAPGAKIKPGEAGNRELWNSIRDEVLFQHQYIANLPPKVKELIKFSVKGKELTPADYEKLFALAKKIEAMPVGQANDYASKVTATPTDLDVFERSVDKYLAGAAARDKDNAERDTVHTKLVGLEEVYKKYQLYQSLVTSGSMSAIGAGIPGGGGNVGGGIVISREAEKLRQELEVDVKAHGFSGLDDFRAWIARFEQAFEKESVNIALDLLGKLAGNLFKEQERYRDPAQVSALHQKLGGMRSAYAELETHAAIYNEWVRTKDQHRIPGQGHLHPKSTRAEAMEAKQRAEAAKAKAMAQYEDVAADHPILEEEGLPDDKKLDKVALAKAGERELGGILQAQISRRMSDIGEAKGQIEGRHELIYKMDKLLPQFYAQQGIKPGSIHDLIIQAKMRSDAVLKLVKGLAITIVAVAVAVVSLGTATPAIVAAGAAGVGAGISAWQAYESYQEYTQEKDLADVGLAQDPSMGWLVLAVASAALDMAAAVKAVRALGKAAKALEAGGDLKSFLATVKELEKQGELTASVARATEKAAAARKGVQDASLELTKAMAGKAYSFPGPLLDPEVYAVVLKLARNAVKSKVYDAEKFITELRLARTDAKLADLSPQELAKAKQAWEAAKALEVAEGATRARLASHVSSAAKLDKLIEQVGDAAALERLLKVFPEAELDGILAQLKDAKTLVNILDHTGAETGAGIIRKRMAEGAKGFAKMNQFLERMAAGGKELAETTAVGSKAVIIDSQVAIALMKDADPALAAARPLQEGEMLWIAHIKSLPAGTELRVGNVTVGEVKGGVINLKGMPLEVTRDSTEYKNVLAALAKEKVGTKTGFGDRGVIADALFAKNEGNAVPKLLMADGDAVKKLFQMMGGDVVKVGGYEGLVKTYGSTGFEVAIEGRKLRIVPMPIPPIPPKGS